MGTREGYLVMIDVAAGNVVRFEEDAHEGAIWSIDVKRPTADDPSIHVLTGSADKSVKFWSIEADEDENDKNPCFVHTRTLQMTDDVIAAKYSKTPEYSKRLVFVSTLDSTIKVFFDDSLKLFLSLYGHKLPALAVDCTDDDMLLASSGADKTVKIWGLDFGDTHKTLLGHEDSVTDLRFVRGTHNFFSCSKDGSIRYWDGDRFEQILLIEGHFAEVSSLAIARTGAFVLSAGQRISCFCRRNVKENWIESSTRTAAERKEKRLRSWIGTALRKRMKTPEIQTNLAAMLLSSEVY
jgi:U3 small nucleolar RNA-associated protein 12